MPLLQHHKKAKLGDFGKTLGSRKVGRFAQNVPSVLSSPEAIKNAAVFGFKAFALNQDPERLNGPGYESPPPGLIRGTTSMSEWYIYWALTKILGKEGMQWVYQQQAMGGRHTPGGAVVDFVVYWHGVAYGMRLQTYRYHIAAGPVKQGYDRRQLYDLSTPWMRILDIFEEDFLFDPTGQAAIKVTMDALNGNYALSPIASGRAQGLG